MKTSIRTAFNAAATALALAGASNIGSAQVTVNIDPGQNWIGFMNVFNLPADGFGYQFGSGWGTSDLRASFSGNTLTLAPCINVWETSDTYWVKADGVSPNKFMDANMYVQSTALAGQTVTFIGATIANTLVSNYTSVAFIKDFTTNFALVNSISVPLVSGQAFKFSLATQAGDVIQYGFETEGPDANPATVAGLGSVVIVPEPSCLALLGFGIIGALPWRRRQGTRFLKAAAEKAPA